jgi:cobalt-zinc-cadmium efflux system membrane fusion protein
MKRAPFAVTTLFIALGLFLTGCGESKSDPKAEAPPPTTVEKEQDFTVIQVDHPEQFPLATAVAHEFTS